MEMNSRQELLKSDLKLLFESGAVKLSLHEKRGQLHVGLLVDDQRVADAEIDCASVVRGAL